MALLQTLKSLVNERLSAAAEEIFGTVVQIVTEYEDEALSLKQEIDHKNRLLDMVFKLYRTDILQLPLCKERVYPEQQNMNSSLVQEEPQIKEEQEELLLRPEEGLTSLAVKREDDGENRETEPVVSSPDEHMKTQADVEDFGESQPTSDDQLLSSHCSESHTEDSDEWEETSVPALNTLETHITQHMEGQQLSLSKNPTQGLKSTKQMKFHTEKKDFNCKDCGKMFSYESHLKRHTMIHTGEKPFTCIVCGKGCLHMSNLKSHMRTHTGEFPYTCTVCGKGCVSAGKLKTHTRTHTGERPFSCTVCGKGFLHMGDLKRHMRTHTGEKPFSCAVCGKSFAHTGNLKTHEDSHRAKTLV